MSWGEFEIIKRYTTQCNISDMTVVISKCPISYVHIFGQPIFINKLIFIKTVWYPWYMSVGTNWFSEAYVWNEFMPWPLWCTFGAVGPTLLLSHAVLKGAADCWQSDKFPVELSAWILSSSWSTWKSNKNSAFSPAVLTSLLQGVNVHELFSFLRV